MDHLFDFILDLVPHTLGEWILDHWLRVVRKRIKNPVLQIVILVIAIVLAAGLAVAVAVGVFSLIGYLLFDVLRLS